MATATVRVLALRTAGTNCDKETVFAFEQAGSAVDLVHINKLLAEPAILGNYQILVIPGGFSYGDDISAGKIFSVRLRHDLGPALAEFVSKDRLVLGICNGFQILAKTGLLPEPDFSENYQQSVTLADNDSGKFEDRWVWLKSFSEQCVFIEPDRMIYLPVAHAEGKFVPRDDATLKKLIDNDQVVFRYVTEDGGKPQYPDNPNGAVDNIAGICDPTGRILGLMPHPERHVSLTQHPRWTRLGQGVVPHGKVIFESAVNYFA